MPDCYADKDYTIGILDEASDAYKPAEVILSQIDPTANVLHIVNQHMTLNSLNEG